MPLPPKPERRGCVLPVPSLGKTLMVRFWGASGQIDIIVFRDRKMRVGPILPETTEIGKGWSCEFPFLPPQNSRPCLPHPQHPLSSGTLVSWPALTGHVELDGPLCANVSSGESHSTGEVGAVVLGPWGEGEH